MSMIEMTSDEVNEVSGATGGDSIELSWQPTPWYASIDPLTGELVVGHGEIVFNHTQTSHALRG